MRSVCEFERPQNTIGAPSSKIFTQLVSFSFSAISRSQRGGSSISSKDKFEGAVVHGDEMFGAEIFEGFHGLVGAHVDFAKGFRMIRADGQQRDFGRDAAANFFEAVKVGAVAGVINAAALMFQNKSAVAAMLIAQGARAPMFAGREGDLPIVVAKNFPTNRAR